MMSGYSEADKLKAFHEPRVGDRYTDMFSWWMFIVYTAPDRGKVVIMSSPAPCTFPDGGRIETFDTVNEFCNRFSYPSKPGQPWPRLVDRDNDVNGWFDVDAMTAEELG